jgi:Fe-S cluster assembly iron-binding protein IscA
MLTITPSASAALAALLESPEVPPGAGVRIAHGTGPGGEPALGLTIVEQPDPRDIVVGGASGVELYLEPRAADLLADQQLDVEEEGGAMAFTLQPQPLDGGPPNVV